jgi:hypothetical protein
LLDEVVQAKIQAFKNTVAASAFLSEVNWAIDGTATEREEPLGFVQHQHNSSSSSSTSPALEDLRGNGSSLTGESELVSPFHRSALGSNNSNAYLRMNLNIATINVRTLGLKKKCVNLEQNYDSQN